MTEQPLTLTQEQDHDRRLGRLEGIAEQFVEQSRRIDEQGRELRQAIAEQGTRIDEQGSALRQEIAAQGQQTNARFDRIEQTIAKQGSALRQAIDEQGDRIDELMRWVVGIQVISLLALGTLILSRL